MNELLRRLLITHSPGGMEREMDELIRERLAGCSEAIHEDPHGNIFVRFPGKAGGPLTVVSAHKDELSLIVRKIDPDGKIWLDPIGGSRPFKYGEGPFDLITRSGVIEGVLCIGSVHTSELSARAYKAKNELLTWDMVYLDCMLDRKQLEELGAGIGDRAVIGRRRKEPLFLRDQYVCGYALDDKAAVAVLLEFASRLRETEPVHDLCVAFTSKEEGGVSGGPYVSLTLQPHDFIAVEIAPVSEEYEIGLNDRPIVLFKDGHYQYSPDLGRDLVSAGERCGLACQPAVLRNFGSDASYSSRTGLVGRAGCLCFPTLNTHGYEVTHLGALDNCVKVLLEYFTRG